MKETINNIVKLIFKKLFFNTFKAIEQENSINISKKEYLSKSAVIKKSSLRGNIRIDGKSNVFGSTLIGNVTVEEACQLTNAYINNNKKTGNVKIGNNCRLSSCYLQGDIEIGRYTSIWGPNTDIYSNLNKVRIGSFCSIARNVTMQEYNHKTERLTSYFILKNVFGEDLSQDITSKGEIKIGNDVWIGAQCVILSGAEIGDGAVIAANSVVSGKIPPYAIAGGIPARVIKYRFEPQIIAELDKMQWWNWPMEKIIRNRPVFADNLSLEMLQQCN